jgi:hypothetical protein
MHWNLNWALLPDMQVQERVSRLVEELLNKHESKAENESISATWLPVVDLSNLRPN